MVEHRLQQRADEAADAHQTRNIVLVLEVAVQGPGQYRQAEAAGPDGEDHADQVVGKVVGRNREDFPGYDLHPVFERHFGLPVLLLVVDREVRD
ncbi:hypothetical protein D3C78_1508650 [compost metagenome]